MENETHFDYPIEELQEIVDTARRLHKENPIGTVATIRFTKVGDSKPTTELLTSCSIQENIEG